MNISLVSTVLYYLAYGSNMLAERFYINNNGTRTGYGMLKNFRLGFNDYDNIWYGGVATIIPNKGDFLFGVVYKMNASQIEALDKQEFGYDAINVEVSLSNGETVTCRTYQMIELPEEGQEILPSKTYLKVLVKGAEESKLPEAYIKKLRRYKHNGNLSIIKEQELGLESYEL